MSQGEVRALLRDAVVGLLRRGDVTAQKAARLLAFARVAPDLGEARWADAEARAPGAEWLAPLMELVALEAMTDERWREVRDGLRRLVLQRLFESLPGRED